MWIYSKKQLKICILVNGSYQESSQSLVFPNLPIITLIPQLVKEAINQGTSKMLRKLKTQYL